MIVTNERTELIFSKSWIGFHDMVVDLTNVTPSASQAKVMFELLPEHRQLEAEKFGIEDTEFLTAAYLYFENYPALLKNVLGGNNADE